MRYIIGIDLGTTNSCVSYVDTEQANLSIQPFHILQLTAAGYVDSKPTLPSFCYLAGQEEWPPNSLEMPWNKSKKFLGYFVGQFAQEQGARVPTRLVRSAKSWLCHAAANRRDKILPVEAVDAAQRISPVEATARYLSHIKEAWDHLIAQGDPLSVFSEQEIVLTVPASFDEVARTLTVEAAKCAGFTNMTLLEEPQAAFYSWVSFHESVWKKMLKPGDCILVCDVGGGTTDFSLIEVVDQQGKLAFQRMAVGDHLLLGGDNMDAALAHQLQIKLGLKDPSTLQWLQLCHEARSAKEALLAPNAKLSDSYKVLLQGSGSGVVRGSLSTEMTRQEVEDCLLNGFFCQYDWQEAVQLKKARGLRTMGLPYEDEPSITKHLAYFLQVNNRSPHYILFNGGVMKAPILQQAILGSLKKWFPQKNLVVLQSANLDLAVARGAAYYGKVRRGLGVKIGGGAARGYYLAVDINGKTHALSLLPRGSEEGSSYQPETVFWLTPNTPVSFQIYTSHVRLHDKSGDIIPIDPVELQEMPPIHTVLRFGKQQSSKIPVSLKIELSAIGTLELWLASQETDHRWKLEFQVRSSSGQENSLTMLEKRGSDETLDAGKLKNAQNAIQSVFNNSSKQSLSNIMESLENQLGSERRDWSLSTLRKLSDTVLQCSSQRKHSADFEARWWNLIGFFLRPGYSYPLDDFRLKELWKIILADLKAPKALECQIQSWICYRRIAGGLSRGQQTQLASELMPMVIDKKTGKIEVKNRGELYAYSEKLRALSALELIDQPMKIKLGNALMERLSKSDPLPAEYWALGRLGARHLLHGSMVNVLSREVCAKWVLRLLEGKNKHALFAIEQLARKTAHNEINLTSDIIGKILAHYANHDQFPRLKTLLTEESHLTQEEQETIFGERLPIGISIEYRFNGTV